MCKISAVDQLLMDKANEDYFVDTAVIKRTDYSVQTAEGTVARNADSLVTIATVACFAQPFDMTGKIEQLGVRAGEFQTKAFYQIVFPRVTDCRSDDTVFIGSREFHVVADGNAIGLAVDHSVVAVEVVIN